SSEMPWHIEMVKSVSEKELESLSLGQRIYTVNCITCHGADRLGNPNSGFPSLDSIVERKGAEYVKDIFSNGKGMMPAFGSKFSHEEKEALVAFLNGQEEKSTKITKEPGLNKEDNKKIPYRISDYTKFLDNRGYPAVRPPWGTLNAIDLNTGEYVWKVTYGEYPELIEKGIPQPGAESYGGPVVTASGILFIAGTKDGKFRAYDTKN